MIATYIKDSDPDPRTSRSFWLDSNANLSKVSQFIFNGPLLRHSSDTLLLCYLD